MGEPDMYLKRSLLNLLNDPNFLSDNILDRHIDRKSCMVFHLAS